MKQIDKIKEKYPIEYTARYVSTKNFWIITIKHMNMLKTNI